MGAGGFSGESLAVFTAVSPSAAVAFACLAVVILVRPRTPFIDRLNHMLAVPLALCWLGFMASATHLGTPANALHAISGIGRSPLSDEVVAAVAFLFCAGVYWLHSFKLKPSEAVSKLLLAASVLTAAGLVGFMATAYSVPTVPSWDTWRTPVNLVLTALFAGPVIAAATLQLTAFLEVRMPVRPQGADAQAQAAPAAEPRLAAEPGANAEPDAAQVLPARWVRISQAVFIIGSVALLLAGTALLFDHAAFLATVSNNVRTASELVPDYAAYILFHIVFGLGACVAQAAAMRCSSKSYSAMLLHASAVAAALLSALLARVPFYMAYLSVGF